ncbi:hypothetical protein NFI96_009710 [Prochilodus magdalenae]|nr:hypothetical protein NFI96_009710 [Prochilodus magdalenae]
MDYSLDLYTYRVSCMCSRKPEGPQRPNSFFSEIISSVSDVKFRSTQRPLYDDTGDYLTQSRSGTSTWRRQPVETYQVHEYLRSKLCSLYENDCIFDKFECCWSQDDSEVMTGSYNNFFRTFGRDGQPGVTLEASWESSSPRCPLRPWRVCAGSRRKENEIGVDCLDFSRKILHTSWHPQDGVIAMATVNNLYIFQEKLN